MKPERQQGLLLETQRIVAALSAHAAAIVVIQDSITAIEGEIAAATPVPAPFAGLGTGDGIVGDPGGSSTGKFYKDDGSWAVPTGLQVSNTPAGTIASTTVQAALNELDTDSRMSDSRAPNGSAGGCLTGTYPNPTPATGFTFPAGSSSAASWPKLTAGTVMTTAEDGAIEMDADCIYACTDAGNRGVVPIEHIIRCDGTRTLPNDTNLNAIFNSPANGRLTLETGTYMFEMLMQVTSMSATSGNAKIDILGAGGATMASVLFYHTANDSSTPSSIVAFQSAVAVTKATPAATATAGAGTGFNFYARGSFEITGAGTIVPSILLATAAAGVVGIGSFFKCNRIGSTSVVSVGQWD